MRRPALFLLLALTAHAELKTDIIFTSTAGTNLTLDAYVPDGDGPFPSILLVHGGAWMNGTKTSYISPLFEPLSRAKFTSDLRNHASTGGHQT